MGPEAPGLSEARRTIFTQYLIQLYFSYTANRGRSHFKRIFLYFKLLNRRRQWFPNTFFCTTFSRSLVTFLHSRQSRYLRTDSFLFASKNTIRGSSLSQHLWRELFNVFEIWFHLDRLLDDNKTTIYMEPFWSRNWTLRTVDGMLPYVWKYIPRTNFRLIREREKSVFITFSAKKRFGPALYC